MARVCSVIYLTAETLSLSERCAGEVRSESERLRGERVPREFCLLRI